MPEDPVFLAEETEFLMREVVAQSVHTASPSFVGHMTSALPYFMLPLSKVMIALNQNQVKIETSKAFTPLERQVIAMLHHAFFGKTDAFYREHVQARESVLGVLTSGGTVANLTSLWVARNQLLRGDDQFPDIRDAGLAGAMIARGWKGLRIYASERAHYSLKKAADILGLGRQALRLVPTDASFRVKPAAMSAMIAEDRAKGYAPLAIIGIAGATETGAIDPLDDLAGIARDQHTFFHVDAAWGGPTQFSTKHRHLLKGIEKCDALTIDAHKQLYVPMGAGFVLFRDPRAAHAIESQLFTLCVALARSGALFTRRVTPWHGAFCAFGSARYGSKGIRTSY